MSFDFAWAGTRGHVPSPRAPELYDLTHPVDPATALVLLPTAHARQGLGAKIDQKSSVRLCVRSVRSGRSNLELEVVGFC